MLMRSFVVVLAAALASGAQYVSTDYMRPDSRLSAYRAGLPQGVVARPNPLRVGAPSGGQLKIE